MTAPELKTRGWQEFRAWYLANCGDTCSICGHFVDKTIQGRNRWGPSIDHIIPRSMGGALLDPANCALAHQGCNSSKRDRIRRRRRVTSRVW